jgi:CDP-diacylglycerol--glycerol-3-phosphate 3-phosphatidyltransferase
VSSSPPFTYDASAVMTPANAVTLGRLLLSPVLVLIIVLAEGPSYPALVLGTLIALTDSVDGQLARRHGVTRSGAFLDPLADKVLVLGSLGALVQVGTLPLWPVALIAARELGISLYRSYWARRGLAIPARPSAKFKTVVQEFAAAFALLPWLDRHAPGIALGTLWLAVVLTLVTGGQYLLDGRRALSRTGKSEDAHDL